jgi:hypothetical protein
MVVKGRSFMNALTKEDPKGKVDSGDLLEVQTKSLEVVVNDDLLNQLQASFVGFLVEETDIVKVNEGLVMEGYNWITTVSMSGNMVLLSTTTSQSIKEAVAANVKWWEGWFRSILEWSPDLFLDRRAVWLMCRGVPLHAWDESLFRSIADRFGSFIELDPSTANRRKLDIARVKISSSKMESIDTVINIVVMGKTYQIWVVEEMERDVVVCDRGGRHVDEWAATASSVASAVEREALVIGEDLSEGGGDDGDVACIEAEEVDQVGEGRKRCFDDTRKGVDIGTAVSENFMGQLGNTQVQCDQVEAVATSLREACDGLPSQLDLGEFLENGPDGDKWQRTDRPQEMLGVGNLVDQTVVDPIGPLNLNSNIEGADGEGKYLGPISIGPNSFGPLSDLNPDVEVGEEVTGGVKVSPVDMGLVKMAQQSGIQNEGVGGLVIQLQANVSVPKQCGEKAKDKEQQVSQYEAGNSVADNTTIEGGKAKKKMKKGQSALTGMPKCLQFVDAVQGGKRGGRKRRKKKEVNQYKGDVAPSDDSISNSDFSSHSSSKSVHSGGGELLPQAGVGGSAEFSSNGEDNRKILEARKIIDIQEGLGLVFAGSPITEAQRGVALEDLDRAKIEDWEKKRYQ